MPCPPSEAGRNPRFSNPRFSPGRRARAPSEPRARHLGRPHADARRDRKAESPPEQSLLLLRPLCQAAGLVAGSVGRGPGRAQPPGQGCQGAAGRGDRAVARHAGHAGGLAPGHRAGLRHRGGGDGALVASGGAGRRCAELGVLLRRMGQRHRHAAPLAGCAGAEGALWATARPRRRGLGAGRGLRVERHDLGRAVPDGAGSRRTGKDWRSAMPPRRPSPWTCPGTGSMW